LSNAQKNVKENDDKISSENGILEALNSQLILLKSQRDNARTDLSSFKEMADKSIEEIKKLNDEYREECGDKAQHLDSALKALLEKTQIGKRDEAMNDFKTNLYTAFGQTI